MPLVDAVCPHCGAPLKVNPDAKTLTCRYCGNEFVVQEAINNVNIKDSVVNNDMRGSTIYINNVENKTVGPEDKSSWPKPNTGTDVKDKIKRNKLIVTIVWSLITVVLFVVGLCFIGSETSWPIYAFIFVALIALIIVIGNIGLVHITERTIDGYKVLVYAGWFIAILSIDNKIIEKTASHNLYGELPNGKPIYAEVSHWDNSVRISVNS